MATLLSVVQRAEGKLVLLVAEGEAVPGPTLQIGNTNSRYRFAIGAKAFIHRWSLAGPATGTRNLRFQSACAWRRITTGTSGKLRAWPRQKLLESSSWEKP